ncbi:MAG: 4-alpha-glucanotransferase, partial [Solimonas sp.]
AAQRAARQAGMAIGLIGDLAVGTDSGGSHAWSRQRDMLNKLSVGAPPDLLNALGQSWGLTAFSPRALRRHGYDAFIEMLRANLRHVGGLRIDHVLGLRRLWLVPEGAHAAEGAYLQCPFDDFLRLIALESHRHRAVIVGEDLGTVPEGFRDALYGSGLMGMRVLWFERDHGLFVEPRRWPAGAMATTATHDLPTVAGWWQGRDIDWRQQLQLFAPGSNAAQEQAERRDERHKLWAAFRHAGVVETDEPPPDQADAAIDAALRFVARTPSELAIVPAEDLAGLVEQPNLPGTTIEHPNWRRRLPADAATLFADPLFKRRLDLIAAERPPKR